MDQGNELNFPILELSYDMRMSDFSSFIKQHTEKLKGSAQAQNDTTGCSMTALANTDKPMPTAAGAWVNHPHTTAYGKRVSRATIAADRSRHGTQKDLGESVAGVGVASMGWLQVEGG